MLKLFNSLTQKIEPFVPIDSANVKMYSCGPSTYQPAHIGNYRTFLYEDILQRYIEYLGFKVTRTMPLTDIEDKAILQAKKEGLTLETLTQKNQAIFFGDFEFLHIKKPDYPMPASNAIDQAVELTRKLVNLGYAYWYKFRGVKNAYFMPLKFKGFGMLSHLDMSKWPKKPRRFHKDTYPGTPWNMGDFILWHGCGLEDTCYETSIGMGRPAWNIQDVAIVTKTLGFEIDVACGGIDNLVRHHDYNIAIAEAVSGKQFSRFWLHGGHLLVDGKKMSKSKGNVIYPNDVSARGFSGEELRFFLIYRAYHEELNFTYEKLAEAKHKLDEVRRWAADLAQTVFIGDGDSNQSTIRSVFEAHMDNNLDVEGAFGAVTKEVREIHKRRGNLRAGELKRVLEDLHRVDSVLQCIF
jgi:cysteinyl-tRNA synthetase